MLSHYVLRSSPLWLQALSFSPTTTVLRMTHFDHQDECSSRLHTIIKDDHLLHQQRVFDEMADTFARGDTITDDLVPVYQSMCDTILADLLLNVTILDGACGTGALWPFLPTATCQIVGVDVSAKMCEAARTNSVNYKKITVVQNDLVSYCETTDQTFDLVILNACFGNFLNSSQVLEAVCRVLKLGGRLAVTHPLGSQFVQKLHDQDPAMVPGLLPNDSLQWSELCGHKLPLRIKTCLDDTFFYCAKLEKVRAIGLDTVMRFRGNVDSGYGRGGKKLGFPTANLPNRYFQNALSTVENGVYFGWAYLERREIVYKAVVNVGLSPTFEGQENPEKIIEAHLIEDEPIKDFYGEPMRLQLVGFLRPEMKFPSFPDLIAQINQDVVDAKEALDWEIYRSLGRDHFLNGLSIDDQDGITWIGSNGGDEFASWEFRPMQEALDDL